MNLEKALVEYIKECDEKIETYSRRAEYRAAVGEREVAQTWSDWAFLYSCVARRLRQILRDAKKEREGDNELAQSEN